jgi:3-(3-hydroxy-phenyl)propionate hydroxylase
MTSAKYSHRRYPFTAPPGLKSGREHHRVVIVGAGPVGLAAAGLCAMQGIATVVLNDEDMVSIGSRAICWSKRTLEILDRVGVADRMVKKGVVWNRGRLFHGDGEVYNFDLLPEAGHKMPAFINLQQYYCEEYLADRVQELGATDLRWSNKLVGISKIAGGGVLLEVETPEGNYQIEADHVLACDGVRSQIRRLLGLDFAGKVFEDRFLITDVRMTADFPSERWFWFDPPFHNGKSALLHRQPDNVFRIDLQLDPDSDPQEESREENVIPRIKAMIGEDVAFDLEWISVYTFTCRRMERFRHGDVTFLGDSAHVVSPFGARGGNGGIQDVDNLVWKLAHVLDGTAPASLLDSYDDERIQAADENLLNSSRSTDFMTPKNAASADFRQAALDLAATQTFARALVNSGRLSTPHTYIATPLTTPDRDEFKAGPRPGAPAVDAPIVDGLGEDWLLRRLAGHFSLLYFGDEREATSLMSLLDADLAGAISIVALSQELGVPAAYTRYDALPGTCYLVRPDQHVAARWRQASPEDVSSAMLRSLGRDTV